MPPQTHTPAYYRLRTLARAITRTLLAVLIFGAASITDIRL